MDRRPGLAGTLRPMAIDIGIPLGTYYLLRDAFGVTAAGRMAVRRCPAAMRVDAGRPVPDWFPIADWRA